MAETLNPSTASPLFGSNTPPTMYFSPRPKRRAASPPLLDPNQPGPSTYSMQDASPHREKRRRHNLANAVSSLSINPRSSRNTPEPLPSYDESQETRSEIDDDDHGLAQDEDLLSPEDDLHVEVLPEHTRRDRHLTFSSSSSETTDDEHPPHQGSYRQPRRLHRRQAINTQHADSVEQPNTPWDRCNGQLGVEEVTSPTRRRKRTGDQDPLRFRKRRRSEMDMDMDMDGGDQNAEFIEEIRRQKMPSSYEPEKDRIVVTSLSDTESERSSTSRSASPQLRREFTQPGDQGFTLHPSLLTHLLANPRDHLPQHFKGPAPEKGLVLYRPLGIHAVQNPEIVQQWPGQPATSDDASRFEVLDEDEDTSIGPLADEGGMDVDVEEPMQLD